MKRRGIVTLVLLGLAAAPTALGQSEDQLRAKELKEKIKREMAEIDRLLLEEPPAAGAANETDRGETAKRLARVTEKQRWVVEAIEELVRLQPHEKGS